MSEESRAYELNRQLREARLQHAATARTMSWDERAGKRGCVGMEMWMRRWKGELPEWTRGRWSAS